MKQRLYGYFAGDMGLKQMLLPHLLKTLSTRVNLRPNKSRPTARGKPDPAGGGNATQNVNKLKKKK